VDCAQIVYGSVGYPTLHGTLMLPWGKHTHVLTRVELHSQGVAINMLRRHPYTYTCSRHVCKVTFWLHFF
jgi:hypothetical protein